ncbi:hypothetical protein ACFLSF_05095, partial [Candidatus Bipolaricaulota bacterium]
KRMGAVDEEQLASALSMQMANGRKKLLGEILVDLGWVDEATIRHAVDLQRVGGSSAPRSGGPDVP